MNRVCVFVLIYLWLAGGAARAQEKKESAPATSTTEVKSDSKPAVAAVAANDAPTVDQIIAKHVQAIGGKEAFEKLNTRTAKGAFELPSMGASGTVEMYAKAPNKIFTLVSIPGFGEIKQGFDGATAWAQDPNTGKINDLSGTDLSETKTNADFRFDLKLKELYPQMSLKGKEDSGGREAFVIEATAPGVSKKMYFDAQTGLLSRIDSVRESADGKRAIEEYYSDYKELDGVKFAHTYRQKNPQYDFQFKFDDVKHNQTIDDAKFVKPAQ
jgi:zinc protease